MSASIATYMSSYMGSLIEENLDAMFEEYDKDKNGFIDAQELDGFITGIFSKELSKEKITEFKKELLERVDNNNDGKIDKEELRSILPTKQNFLKQFTKVGKNMCGVDFVKIWNHYDPEKKGKLQGELLEGFLRDLILKGRPDTPDDDNLKCSINKLKNWFPSDGAEEGISKAALFDFFQVEASCASFKGTSSKDFDAEFAKYDTDNSGAIEGDELVKLLSDLYLIDNETDVNEIKDVVLLKVDSNRDNKIQKSELKEFLQIQD